VVVCCLLLKARHEMARAPLARSKGSSLVTQVKTSKLLTKTLLYIFLVCFMQSSAIFFQCRHSDELYGLLHGDHSQPARFRKKLRLHKTFSWPKTSLKLIKNHAATREISNTLAESESNIHSSQTTGYKPTTSRVFLLEANYATSPHSPRSPFHRSNLFSSCGTRVVVLLPNPDMRSF
jgi:hypothetical protein